MRLNDLVKDKIKHNPVAKNAGINRASTHKDKKKALLNPRKNQKHRKKVFESALPLFEEEKVWTKEEIRNKIKTDDRWLMRAVYAIYKLQTEDEKADKTTKHLNNIGFNGVDAVFLSQAAERYRKNYNFSPKYMEAIRRAMLKYSGQLTKIANKRI